MARTVTEGFPIKSFAGITIITNLLSSTSNYYSYESRNIKYIVMHYTGNSSDTAKANANYFHSGSRGASAHYFVDENTCYQSVALNNAAWAVGGTSHYKHKDCRNLNSVNIEMCCSGGHVVSKKTISNAAYLCAELCKHLDISAGNVDTYVLRHYDVWDKSCPAQWANDNSQGWADFKEMVKRILNGSEGLTVTQYEELKSEIAGLKKAIEEIKPKIYRYMDNNMPEWAKPTVQKLMDRGIISGVADNCLDLSNDLLRLIVINDRAGLYD